MGTYFNPAQELPNVGRPVDGRTFAELQAGTRTGEKLFALCDRGIFPFAVEIYDQREYDEFYGQYKTGHLLDIRFYAVPEEALTGHVS